MTGSMVNHRAPRNYWWSHLDAELLAARDEYRAKAPDLCADVIESIGDEMIRREAFRAHLRERASPNQSPRHAIHSGRYLLKDPA